MKRNRRGRALVVVSCVVLSSALGSVRAFAAPEATPEEKALATTLFNEAKTLLDAGKVSEACRKLEESERIYPAGGTLLNLAVCHEKEGKTATAWAEFREARVIAQRDQRDDRIALAEERMKALEPKLSKLVITVSSAVDVPGMEVTVDAHAMHRAAWGTQAPVDPGDHVVEASAPGKKKWSARVTVAPNGDTKTVVIPAWEDAPATPAPVTPVPAPTEPPAPVRVESPPPATSPTRSRAPAIIAGAIGIGGVAMGSYFGLRAIAKHNDSNDACARNQCQGAGTSLNDSSKTAADISTGAFIVGVVGLGLGAYFWFSGGEPNAATSTHTVRIAPSLGPGRGTLDIRGTF